jgi:transposase
MMTEFLAEQRQWLDVRRLPTYAPELNPAEGLWANLKSRELANRCENHMQMVTIAARQGANRVRSQRSLLIGFQRSTGLQL